MTDLEKLALATAMEKALRQYTSQRGGEHGASTLRTEADLALREDYERDGTDRRRLRLNGVDVGTLSARIKHGTTEVVPYVCDQRALLEWLQSEDSTDFLAHIIATHPDVLLAAVKETGEVPDGVEFDDVTIPESWLGTTLRVDTDKVAQALGAGLPQAVAGLLGMAEA